MRYEDALAATAEDALSLGVYGCDRDANARRLEVARGIWEEIRERQHHQASVVDRPFGLDLVTAERGDLGQVLDHEDFQESLMDHLSQQREDWLTAAPSERARISEVLTVRGDLREPRPVTVIFTPDEQRTLLRALREQATRAQAAVDVAHESGDGAVDREHHLERMDTNLAKVANTNRLAERVEAAREQPSPPTASRHQIPGLRERIEGLKQSVEARKHAQEPEAPLPPPGQDRSGHQAPRL